MPGTHKPKPKPRPKPPRREADLHPDDLYDQHNHWTMTPLMAFGAAVDWNNIKIDRTPLPYWREEVA